MKKQELKNILSEDIDKCLINLSEIIGQDNRNYNDFVVLQKKHLEVESAKMKGIINFEIWTTLNSQIIDGILNLIDKLFENGIEKIIDKNKGFPKEILNAVNWLENSIIGAGYEYTTKDRYHDKIKSIALKSESVTKCTIDNDGTINLIIKTKLRRNDYVERDGSLYIRIDLDIESIISGNLKDIDDVEIKESKEKREGFHVIASAKDGQNLFYERFKSVTKSWEKQNDKVGIDEGSFISDDDYFPFQDVDEDSSTSNNDCFVFQIDNLGLAKRIKDCLEHLAKYFKEKDSFH